MSTAGASSPPLSQGFGYGIILGLGFAFGSWLSLAIIVVAALIGFGYRIRVEERALVEHFGDRYRSYRFLLFRHLPKLAGRNRALEMF